MSMDVDINQQRECLIIDETINQLRFIRQLALRDNQGELFEDSSEMMQEMRKERMQYLEDVGESHEKNRNRCLFRS